MSRFISPRHRYPHMRGCGHFDIFLLFYVWQSIMVFPLNVFKVKYKIKKLNTVGVLYKYLATCNKDSIH